MKTVRRCFVRLIGLVLMFGTLMAQERQQSPSVAGTYEYTLENEEGLAILTDTHFIWLLSQKGRKPFENQHPTDSAKAVAFSSSYADAGTYQFVGPSRIKIHRLYSSNPNLIGKDFTFEYQIEGEVFKYWILKSDGTRGEKGSSRRIK